MMMQKQLSHLFRWETHGVALMVAPWRSKETMQTFTTARQVVVTEETMPQYSLVFNIHCDIPKAGPATLQLQRKVSKQHMTRAFEMAVIQVNGGMGWLYTRISSKHKQEQLSDIDTAIKQWLIHGKAAPTRLEIVQWLLSRMILVETGEMEWSLCICGEPGAERSCDKIESPDSSFCMINEEHEDLPPPYEETFENVRCMYSDDEEDGDESKYKGDNMFRNAGAGGDEDAVPEEEIKIDIVNVPVKFDKSRTVLASTLQTAAGSQLMKDAAQQEQKQHRRRTVDMDFTKKLATQSEQHSQFTFEPASTRTQSRRYSSSSSLKNEWADDCRHFQQALHMSKRDIARTKELQRKAEAIAALRHQQIIQQTQRKLQQNDQKRADARRAKQLIIDTLEYNRIRDELDAQVKQTNIAAKREHAKMMQSARVLMGKTDPWKKGPVLGPGPLSQREIDTYYCSTKPGDENEEPIIVYDLHGRRHSATKAGKIAQDGAFDSAMEKIQRLLLRSGKKSIETFRKYDTNRSGKLDRGEFECIFRENGVTFSPEQANAFFRHFDPNQSGEIDYGELLWGFFNRRAFLKRWRERKTQRSAYEIKLLFYQYDRSGRGALSPKDFQLAMDDLGFRVSETEMKLLTVKFDIDGDGYIDYREFCSFLNECDHANEEVRLHAKAPQATRTQTYKVKTGKVEEIPHEHEGSSDMKRIVHELQELMSTQKKIRQLISS